MGRGRDQVVFWIEAREVFPSSLTTRQGIDDESPTTVRLPTRCQSTHQTFDEDPEDSTPGFGVLGAPLAECGCICS